MNFIIYKFNSVKWVYTLLIYPCHLHQPVEEHQNSSSSIGEHFRDIYSLAPKDLTKNFNVLMKYTNKFDCLVYEMFFIHELRPILNVNLTQFVLSFSLGFMFVFVVCFHYTCKYLFFLRAYVNFNCFILPLTW